VHSDKQLNRLLLELGALGLLVIGIAAAIFMIRVSTKRVAHADSDDG
jgi:F0F1-type ATP synthase assembly protein I